MYNRNENIQYVPEQRRSPYEQHSPYEQQNSPYQQQENQQQQYFDNTNYTELPTDFLDTQLNFDELANGSFFENANFDFLNFPLEALNSQEAILMSDPNFVRQQQLLSNEQKDEMTTPTPLHERNLNKNSETNQLSVPEINKIDHQRRFNELQARFRVNNVRKPQANKSFSNNRKSKSPQEIPNCIELPLFTPLDTSTTPTTPPVALGNSPNEQLSSSFPSRTMPIQIQRVSRPSQGQHMDAESYQKQLDSELDKVDFDDITVAELKEMLRQRGKPATGKKSVLVQRLQEERDTTRNRANRHSLPVSRSYNSIDNVQQRPRSFHESNNSPQSPYYLPLLSPGSQLNKSMGNLNINSPPATSRRYSPYSPRSPKPPSFEYSVPLSSSPNQQTSPGTIDPARLTPGRYYNNAKSYKPYTSSALATPDREEDVNPFDTYYENRDPPIKEEETSISNHVDWADPATLEFLLQQQDNHVLDMNQPLYSDDYSSEQLLALFNSPSCNFKLDESVLNNNNKN